MARIILFVAVLFAFFSCKHDREIDNPDINPKVLWKVGEHAAWVNYSDFDDTTLTGEMCNYTGSNYLLDLNNDLNNDFQFWLITGHVLGTGECYGSITITGLDSNLVSATIMSYGDSISTGMNWASSLNIDDAGQDRYLALKLNTLNAQYGWVKFCSGGYLSLTIKESGYFQN